MPHIRVLVVDDHALFREGICSLLRRKPDLTVVGQASNGREALAQAQALRPHVILMDILMPELDGLEATRQIKMLYPETRILVLTQHEDTEYVLPLLQAGASGYILKRASSAELVSAIRTVFNEGVFLQPSVARAMMNQLSQDTSAHEPHLTDREKEVLILIAQGLMGREIAEKLHVSEKTVISHRSNIMEKLGIHHTADLVRYAIREGWVKP